LEEKTKEVKNHFSKLFHTVIDLGYWALLKPREKAVYIALLRYANFLTRNCRPTLEKISKASGVYIRQIYKVTAELKKIGLINKWQLGNRTYYHIKIDMIPQNKDTYLGKQHLKSKKQLIRETEKGRFIKGTSKQGISKERILGDVPQIKVDHVPQNKDTYRYDTSKQGNRIDRDKGIETTTRVADVVFQIFSVFKEAKESLSQSSIRNIIGDKDITKALSRAQAVVERAKQGKVRSIVAYWRDCMNNDRDPPGTKAEQQAEQDDSQEEELTGHGHPFLYIPSEVEQIAKEKWPYLPDCEHAVIKLIELTNPNWEFKGKLTPSKQQQMIDTIKNWKKEL